MSSPPEPIPDWKLERFALQELPAAEMGRVQQQLTEDADLRQRLEALRCDDEAILQRYPAEWMARRIEARRADRVRIAADPSPGTRWWRWSPALAIGLVAAAVLTTLPTAPERPSVSDLSVQARPEQVRIKGAGPRLFLHRKTPSGSERLAEGAGVTAGDRLRLQYDAAGAAYGLILSIDGAGAVTRLLPLAGPVAAPLGRGLVALDFAYELDAAPGWERFYFITGDAPFDVEPVLAVATAAAHARGAPPARLSLPSGLGQAGLTLEKPPSGS